METTEFKIILLGSSGVGKTCIITRFTNNEYIKVDSTLKLDISKAIVRRKGQKYELKIWDTAGSERFRGLTRQYFHNSQGTLLVFGYDNKNSFGEIDYWLRVIDEKAKDLGIPFVEVSAKKGEGINEAFNQLLDMMIENKAKDKQEVIQNDAVVLIHEEACPEDVPLQKTKIEHVTNKYQKDVTKQGVIVEEINMHADSKFCSC